MGICLSESDHQRLQKALSWCERIGYTLLPNMFRRNPRLAGSGGGTDIRRCRIAEVVSNHAYVKASLLNRTTGIAATEGDEFEIDVYMDIAGGIRMDRACPLLAIGQECGCYQAVYDNNGTPVTRWVIIPPANAAEDYVGEN